MLKNNIILIPLISFGFLHSDMVFDASKNTFIDKPQQIVYKIDKIDELNDKILKFEKIKINEHKLYDLKELEPEPINIREIEAFKELEIIDISNNLNIRPDDYNLSDGDMYTALFFEDKKELTYESKQKLKKIFKTLNGIENFEIRIESNYYSLENEQFNYSGSIVNGQRIKDKFLLETYALEDNIDIIPFGSKNLLCVKNVKKCLNANTRIELFINIKESN